MTEHCCFCIFCCCVCFRLFQIFADFRDTSFLHGARVQKFIQSFDTMLRYFQPISKIEPLKNELSPSRCEQDENELERGRGGGRGGDGGGGRGGARESENQEPPAKRNKSRSQAQSAVNSAWWRSHGHSDGTSRDPLKELAQSPNQSSSSRTRRRYVTATESKQHRTQVNEQLGLVPANVGNHSHSHDDAACKTQSRKSQAAHENPVSSCASSCASTSPISFVSSSPSPTSTFAASQASARRDLPVDNTEFPVLSALPARKMRAYDMEVDPEYQHQKLIEMIELVAPTIQQLDDWLQEKARAMWMDVEVVKYPALRRSQLARLRYRIMSALRTDSSSLASSKNSGGAQRSAREEVCSIIRQMCPDAIVADADSSSSSVSFAGAVSLDKLSNRCLHFLWAWTVEYDRRTRTRTRSRSSVSPSTSLHSPASLASPSCSREEALSEREQMDQLSQLVDTLFAAQQSRHWTSPSALALIQ